MGAHLPGAPNPRHAAVTALISDVQGRTGIRRKQPFARLIFPISWTGFALA